jgi:hypothetical protein
MLDEPQSLAGRAEEYEFLGSATDDTMADDLSFGICEKRFTACAGRQPFDVVRAEIMQKCSPIAARNGNARPTR